MSPIVITISETKAGLIAFTVQSEEDLPSRSNVKRVFDLVEPRLRAEFSPVRTLFKPIRKAKRGGGS